MRSLRPILALALAALVTTSCGNSGASPRRSAGGDQGGTSGPGDTGGATAGNAAGSNGAAGGSPGTGATGAGGAAGTGGQSSGADAATAGIGGTDASAATEDVAAPPPLDASASDGGARVLPAAEPGPGPIGDGWTEIFPTYGSDQPPGQIRQQLTGSEFHFWVFANDPSTFPGRDSGPRSEIRIRNDYTTGQAQFSADVKVDHDCARASIVQIFGGMTSATSFMAWALPDSLHHYGNELIASGIYDRYIHLNILHDTATRNVDVYVDGTKRATFQDHGPATHYFKCGVYHQVGMTPRCDSYIKNIRVFKK